MQERAPLYEALVRMREMRLVPFDVPGHKHGEGNPELTKFLGKAALSVDVNSMKMLDNLCHPVSVIKDAEALAADAFRAAGACFMVGGTTSSVQAMIMYAAGPGEKIILPRNVHKSVHSALILSGSVPVYVDPGMYAPLGLSLGMDVRKVKEAMDKHPEAKALYVNNPTYYGVVPDIAEMTRLAHERKMLLLADEAHGAHFAFSGKLPLSAMEAGGDLAAVSMHKSGGSLTQSSVLLAGPGVDMGRLRQIVGLTQTTSASYLLMASLDISRRNLALRGEKILDKVLDLVEYAREEINAIDGYCAFSRSLKDKCKVYDFDVTKLAVNTRGLGLTGIEVYDLLRDEYGIQTEFGDTENFLAYVSVGDNLKNIERLVGALADIGENYRKDAAEPEIMPYLPPKVVLSPRDAFYGKKKSLPLKDSAGEVAGEFLMCYPPGIPILAPGEIITQEAVDYIRYAQKKGCQITGTADTSAQQISVMAQA